MNQGRVRCEALILSLRSDMKVHLASLGCKLNQSEMESLQTQLEKAGWESSSAHEADVIVLNTCAVTAEAARKSRQALRRLRAEAPHAHLVATGCYAELWPQEVEQATGPDMVIGNRNKAHLADMLQARFASEPSPNDVKPAALTWPRTRAFIKIQDGCDNACAYCVGFFLFAKAAAGALGGVSRAIEINSGFCYINRKTVRL